MGKNSKIEWTDHTFNPWWGCVKVSEGCKNCYAEKQANRFGDWWGPTAERRFFGDRHWNEPMKWNKQAEKEGVRRKVFCGSMCDVFEDRGDLRSHRRKLYNLIYDTPHLDWLLLTKRPENIEKYYSALPWPNVWLGTSVENQEQADKRIPELLKVPAKVRFLSMEPLLGPVDLSRYLKHDPGICGCESDWEYCPYKDWQIDWVIAGGESGPGARPMYPDWARSIRDQCQDAGVPFFFKQWGAWRQHKGGDFVRFGKKDAGRLLDGREWNEYPEGVS